MISFDQKGFTVTDRMGNQYLICDPFDAGIEVYPTHLTYVTDAFYSRDFLLDLCSFGSMSELLRDLYQYARPHSYQLHKLSDWDIIDQLIHMLATEELKVWLIKDALWDNAPAHIGIDVPMAGSSSGQNQALEQVNRANKAPVASNSNVDDTPLDSQKQPAEYEPSGSTLGEGVTPENTLLIKNESGGTLIFHENLDGHTIRRHVGKTDEQLLQRFETEPDILGSSTYPDIETAQRAVGDVLTKNQNRVKEWLLNSPKPRLTLNETLDYEIGRVIAQGTTVSQPSSKSFVLLVKDPLAPNGYRVHTSFPKPNN